MAYGRPVVATRVGGLADAIEDGVTGLLVEPAAIRGAVAGLLGDAALRARLGAAARTKAVAEYSWTASTQASSDAYAWVLRRS
jgi:D-inositol-3-phosphate glycosyltransferase